MSDYEDNDNDNDMQMEAKAFERVGPSGVLFELLEGSHECKKEKIREMSPEDRFLCFTDATCRKLKDEGVSINDSDINTMLKKAKEKVHELKYKNHIAYILGFLASNGGVGYIDSDGVRKLNRNAVKEVLENVLPKIDEDKGVYPEDVIRYGRYWINFL
jgi:hypothetical protein